jgi:hypothetical protein
MHWPYSIANPLPEIVKVLDAAIRRDSENLRNGYFFGLLLCTGMVFVGLVLEVGEISHDIVGFFKRHKIEWEYAATPALIRREREPSHRVKLWAAVGWLLIVIGVGGEGFFEGFVSWTDSILQAFNNVLLEAAQKEADDAVLGAATANIRVAETRQRAAKLEKEAGQLRKDTEELKSENLQLEAIVQPRSISLENQRRIVDACSEFKGHGAVVQSYGLDTEGFAVASQVIATLQAMKVIVADARASTMVMGSMETGIHVRTANVSEIPFASCVAGALNKIGKLTTTLNDPPLPVGGATLSAGGQSINGPHITVMVGTKPLPLLTNKKSTKSSK